jgi:hypothetical protein
MLAGNRSTSLLLMAPLFISHSSANDAVAIAFDWLPEHGWDDVFLDLDPERGLVVR